MDFLASADRNKVSRNFGRDPTLQFYLSKQPILGQTLESPWFSCYHTQTKMHFVEIDPNMCNPDQGMVMEETLGYSFAPTSNVGNLKRWSICYYSCGDPAGFIEWIVDRDFGGDKCTGEDVRCNNSRTWVPWHWDVPFRVFGCSRK